MAYRVIHHGDTGLYVVKDCETFNDAVGAAKAHARRVNATSQSTLHAVYNVESYEIEALVYVIGLTELATVIFHPAVARKEKV